MLIRQKSSGKNKISKRTAGGETRGHRWLTDSGKVCITPRYPQERAGGNEAGRQGQCEMVKSFALQYKTPGPGLWPVL